MLEGHLGEARLRVLRPPSAEGGATKLSGGSVSGSRPATALTLTNLCHRPATAMGSTAGALGASLGLSVPPSAGGVRAALERELPASTNDAPQILTLE